MRVRSCMRLFSPMVGFIGLSIVAIGVSFGKTKLFRQQVRTSWNERRQWIARIRKPEVLDPQITRITQIGEGYAEPVP
jgi:hypothetical protein